MFGVSFQTLQNHSRLESSGTEFSSLFKFSTSSVWVLIKLWNLKVHILRLKPLPPPTLSNAGVYNPNPTHIHQHKWLWWLFHFEVQREICSPLHYSYEIPCRLGPIQLQHSLASESSSSTCGSKWHVSYHKYVWQFCMRTGLMDSN